MALAYLLDPCLQHQNLEGVNNVAGWFEVFLNGTDDRARVYSDFNGTLCPEHIVIDNNGRCVIIADSSKAYRVEMYGPNGDLIYTQYPVWCMGAGDGNGDHTEVISTDGSITIDKSVVGSTTTYDIGLAPSDNDEFLEWIKCSGEDCGSTWIPVYQSGTMETTELGIKVHAGQLYHFTNTFTVDPDGTGINYDTFQVIMYLNDQVVDTRKFDIDSSLNDAVQCEFSHDLVPSVDGFVSFKLVIPSTCEVAGEVQCHRVYSGINAVPDTCATKQWVSGNYQPLSGMSSYVPYSAVDHNIIGEVTGINGSAIVGSLDSATVSSIASSVASAYTESALSSISSWSADISSISSKADASSLTAYQPVSAMSAYATESYVDSAVSGKLDVTASSMFITSLPADLATTGDVASAVSGKMDSSASSSFYPMTGNPSGFLTAHQSLAGLATEAYVDSAVSGKLDTSAYDSAQFQQASAMSSWIPYSALDYSGTAISGIGGSSLAGMGGGGGADYTGVYPVNVDNTAREISVDSLPLVTDSSMTAYGSAGSSVIGVNMDILTGKLDSSAQVVTATATQLYAGTAYLTGVNGAPVSASRAGNAANASMANSAYYDGTGRLISALPDSATVSAIASAYTTGKQDTLAFAYNTADQISSINGSALGGMDEAAVSSIASAYAESAASSKLDTSAFNSGDFYLTSNPSGFITGVDLTPYQPTSAMSAYATTAYVTSGLSGKENVFSAGEGLEFVQSGSDRVLQVEAPVDIVAGPGIVVDNPDGNTLRVSMAADYEVTLWEGTAGIANFPITLSEVPANFERIRISFKSWSDNPTFNEFPGSDDKYNLNSNWSDQNGVAFYFNERLTLSGTTLLFIAGKFCAFGDSIVNDQSSEFTLYKIVGIHRIANN